MNRITSNISLMLQTLALSLLLTTGAHAAGKPLAANKASVTAAPAAKAKSNVAMAKVNINTADAAAIDQALLNVGPSKAAAIVAYRKEHGAFRTADQLAEVKGIGLKTIEKNRDRIVIGTIAAAAPARTVKR